MPKKTNTAQVSDIVKISKCYVNIMYCLCYVLLCIAIFSELGSCLPSLFFLFIVTKSSLIPGTQ